MSTFGYDEFVTSLTNSQTGTKFYIAKSDTYSVNGLFDYMSIDTNPFKLKKDKVYLRKGVHTISVEPQFKDISFTDTEGKTYAISEMLLADNSAEIFADQQYYSEEFPNQDALVNYSDIRTSPISKQLSKFSDWNGCTAKCGYDSRFKYREVIPEVYTTGAAVPDGPLEVTEECNKFCNDDLQILKKWKEVSRCPATIMPPSTKNEFFVTDTGEKFKSALFIDSLKYAEDPTELLSSWGKATTAELASECHGNELSDQAYMNRGARIFSKDSTTYIEYTSEGNVTLNGADQITYLRKPSETQRIGDYLQLANGVMTFYSTEGNVVDSITLHSAAVSLKIWTSCVAIMDSGNFVIRLIGTPPDSLDVSSGSLNFKSSTVEYAIMSAGDAAVILGTTVKLINAGEVISEFPLPSGSYMSLSSNGIKTLDSALVEKPIAKASDVASFSLAGDSIEFYDKNDCMVRIYGKSYSMLSSGVKIRKPTSADETIPIKSEKSTFVFQTDANIVFYKYGKAVWDSNTQGKAATHMQLEISGELKVMDGTTVLWSNNLNIVDSKFSSIIVTDDWCMLCTQPGEALQVTRTLPNSTNVDAMTAVTKRHAEMIYSRFPAYTVKSLKYKGGITGVPASVADYSDSLNISECGPGDVFCKLTKTLVSSKYVVKPGSATRAVKYTTGEDTYPNASNVFEDKAILGYEQLFLDKFLGLFTTPSINVNGDPCVLMIKKDESDFSKELSESSDYRNLIVSNNSLTSKVMIDLLSLGEGLEISPAFSFMPDIKSSFSNILDEIMQPRIDFLEEHCQGKILSPECATLSQMSPEYYKGQLGGQEIAHMRDQVKESFENNAEFPTWVWVFILVLALTFVFLMLKNIIPKHMEMKSMTSVSPMPSSQ